MKRSKRIKEIKRRESQSKEIKYEADYQKDWAKIVPQLSSYHLEKVDFLSTPGDAPKDFATAFEYRPGRRRRRDRHEKYIAKVGSKYYPNESFTEQLITRIGQTYGVRVADSKLRIVDGQVRFMSKYFLQRGSEQLTHGAEIYELCIGKENYAELVDGKTEREYFTFQITCEAIATAFPQEAPKIIAKYVEMLAFDALIGHNDRHPYNWGVVVPVRKGRPARFAPIFDTARALFWNIPERKIASMLTNRVQFETYLNKCRPPVGWDGENEVDFFRLLGLIWKSCAEHRRRLTKFLSTVSLQRSCEIIDEEFELLMSSECRQLIKQCLHLRRERLLALVNDSEKEEKRNVLAENYEKC